MVRLLLVAAACAGIWACGHDSNPNRPTIAIAAPTPLPQGFQGPFQGLRPVLSVAKSRTLGLVVPLTYRFEVATSSAFSIVVSEGTVSENSAGASFAVPSDLSLGTRYVWRAKAIDVQSGFSSPYSETQSFSTPPLTVPGATVLQIDLSDVCAPFFGQREFTVVGASQVVDGGSRFAGAGQPPFNDLTLTLTQGRSGLTGSVGGNAADLLGFVVSIFESNSRSGSAAINVVETSQNRVAGTFDGFVAVLHPSFAIGSNCSGTSFRWQLGPLPSLP
jgi:hypothetical protein